MMDINYFFGSDLTAFAAEPLRSGVPLQWALDLMCEKLMGVSRIQDPRSLPTYTFVFSHFCWYILHTLPISEWTRNSVTYVLVLILWYHAPERQNHKRIKHRHAYLLKREMATVVGI